MEYNGKIRKYCSILDHLLNVSIDHLIQMGIPNPRNDTSNIPGRALPRGTQIGPTGRFYEKRELGAKLDTKETHGILTPPP
jgi:hypothetical protein